MDAGKCSIMMKRVFAFYLMNVNVKELRPGSCVQQCPSKSVEVYVLNGTTPTISVVEPKEKRSKVMN